MENSEPSTSSSDDVLEMPENLQREIQNVQNTFDISTPIPFSISTSIPVPISAPIPIPGPSRYRSTPYTYEETIRILENRRLRMNIDDEWNYNENDNENENLPLLPPPRNRQDVWNRNNRDRINASMDFPASGDTMLTGSLPFDVLIQRINLPTVSSGYLGSNESEPDSSTSTVNSISSEVRTGNDSSTTDTGVDYVPLIESEIFSATYIPILEENPTPHERNVPRNSQNIPLSVQIIHHMNLESDRNSNSIVESEIEFELNNVYETQGRARVEGIETTVPIQTEIEQIEVFVNTENLNDRWRWDQRELPSPASLVDLDVTECGPDMTSYMRKLIRSPSEEMFSLPISNSISSILIPIKIKKPVFRSISCASFFSQLINSNRFNSHLGLFGTTFSEPHISIHCMSQIILDKPNIIKRSKSFDTLEYFLHKKSELNSKGDYFNNVHEYENIIQETTKADDSGKTSPDGSSVRSRRIDKLLCSLFALCIGQDQQNKNHIVSPVLEEVGDYSELTPKLEQPESELDAINLPPAISKSMLHKDNVEDILEFVLRVSTANDNEGGHAYFTKTSQNTLKELISPSGQILSDVQTPYTMESTCNSSPWKLNVDKTSNQNINVNTLNTDIQYSKNSVVCEENKYLVGLEKKLDFQSYEEGISVMESRKLKTVKFEEIEKTHSDLNRNYDYMDLSISTSGSEETIDITLIPTKFRHSREFSKKEESLRSNSSEFDNQDEIERKSRPRSVTFQDNYPLASYSLRSSRPNPNPRRIEDFSSDEDHSIESIRKSNISFGIKHSTPIASTQNELFQMKMELSSHSNLIINSVESLEQLLHNLQNLWLNVNDGGKIPTLPTSTCGEHRLTQLTSLCSFIVKEMESEWQSFISTPIDTQKLTKLEQSNNCLKEQLESCRVIQGCLESEIKYIAKEKVLLNEEVKHLSMHLAKLESTFGNTNKKQTNNNDNNDSSKFYTKSYPSQQQQQQRTGTGTVSQQSSTDSIGFCVTITEADEDNITGIIPKNKSISNSIGSSTSFEINHNNKNIIKNREDDFNSIMDFFRERGSDINYYQTQLDKYDEEVLNLKQQVEITTTEKIEMKNKYDILYQEHKILMRERSHYEGVLKLILQEKQSNEHSLQDLIEILIQKLNTMSDDSDENNSTRFSLLEGALQAVQEQNVNYREEIGILKKRIANEIETIESEKYKLETDRNQNVQQLNELKNILNLKTNEMVELEKIHEDKLSHVEEIQIAVCLAKTQLEKTLQGKEEEMKKIQETMENLQKNGLRQQKKITELKKINSRLTHDILEQKQNMEALNNIVHQLRSNLKEQKTQWAERFKASGDEACQTKDHCKWLQTQIEHLNHQLKDAHERMKCHEKDKSILAQQVLTAEEERKVIDRKFQELRTAMAGDLVLRQALAERNEALQSEITRMRRVKLMSLGTNLSGGGILNNDGELFNTPPSEMSTMDALSSLNSLPPSIYHTGGDKGVVLKNRYTAATTTYATNRRTNESPRAAVSLHTSGVSTQGNGNQI